MLPKTRSITNIIYRILFWASKRLIPAENFWNVNQVMKKKSYVIFTIKRKFLTRGKTSEKKKGKNENRRP